MNITKRFSSIFQSRFIQPYETAHFEKTKYGRSIKTYQNQFTGKRCFFVGNGPSLQAEDLTRLHESEEITFAFNRIYNIFDDTHWRPSFYISQDEKMLSGCQNVVSKIPLPIKLIPIQLHWYHDINIPEALYFNMQNQQTEDPNSYEFSDNAAQAIYNSSTGMYTAAQFAIYMGFSEIYLIGVDHHFQISQNNKGEIVVDNTVKDYFSDKYNLDKTQLYIPNTEKSTLTYVAMKCHCDHRGVKVFNATRGGKLEVFPRLEFDKLF